MTEASADLTVNNNDGWAWSSLQSLVSLLRIRVRGNNTINNVHCDYIPYYYEQHIVYIAKWSTS